MDLYVINLPGSKERLAFLRGRLQRLEIPFQLHIAAKGSTLPRATYPNSESLSPGELGCAVSHYQLYEKLAKHPEDVACILEDDVRPTKSLKQVLWHFEKNPPPDGVVVLLNAAFIHFHEIVINQNLPSGIKIGIIRTLNGGLGSTGGYILSASTAESLASARQSDWSFPADSWTHYHRSGALKEAWIVLPYPAPPSFRYESTIGYSSKESSPVDAIKRWPILGPFRNLNRRMVWLSNQIPKRIVDHSSKESTLRIILAVKKPRPLLIAKSFRLFGEKLTITSQALLVKAGISRSITCSAGQIFIRRNTSDLTCFKQVFIKQEYAISLPSRISTIVDLGANSGMFCRYIKSCFPGARLIAVEPEPQNYKALQANLALLESSSAINAAIWSEEAEMKTEFKPGGEWGAKTIPVTTVDGNKSSENYIGVPGMTMRMLMEKAGITSIDLLKVDIEGAEIELFKGDCTWLENVGIIAIELHDWITPGCSKAVCTSISSCLEEFSISWRGENLIIYNQTYIASRMPRN